MREIISVLVLFLTSTFNLIADPSDYGKDYLLREEYTDTPIWFVILFIFGIWMIYKLIYIFKFDNNKITKETVLRTEEYSAKKGPNYKCPNCAGTGFIKVGPVYSDGEICKYCYGYGKELNDTALRYYEDIKAEQRLRREEFKNHKEILIGLSVFIPYKSSHLFDEELKKCNICTHCNGKGQIKYDTFYELDERSNIVKYQRYPCPQCNGAGTILMI